jgi:Protein of unknown function (DUF3106)
VKANRFIFSLAVALALPLGGVIPARAQRRMGRVRAQAIRRQRAVQRAERRQIPQTWMNRLQAMSPEQQQRFLANNRRFQNLTPEQQQQIRARVEQWNRLTPEQRQILTRRAQILERMSPQERREIRQVILPEWRELQPARRQVLVGKLRQLQGLSDAEREKRLKNPQFVQGLSPKERDLLKKLAQLRVGPGGNGL